MLAARLRDRWIMAPTPSTRHCSTAWRRPFHRSTVPALPRSRRRTRLNVLSTQVTTCKCGKPVTFEAVPCGCRLACDKCAMKLVRLPVVSMRRVVDASPSRRRPGASAGTARSGTAACAALLAARLRRRSDSGGFPRVLCVSNRVRPCSMTFTTPSPRRSKSIIL